MSSGTFANWFGARSAGLRGSHPPAGQVAPRLDRFSHIVPLLRESDLSAGDGHATLLLATCGRCPSGQVVSSFLDQLGGRVPARARVELLVWGPDAAGWARRPGGLPARVRAHVETDAREAVAVQHLLHVSVSGVGFVYDGTGRWRSTFHLGQLRVDDVAHDLEVLTR